MTEKVCSQLKDIICYFTPCYKCELRMHVCDYMAISEDELVAIAKSKLANATGETKDILAGYAKQEGVYCLLAPKAKIV